MQNGWGLMHSSTPHPKTRSRSNWFPPTQLSPPSISMVHKAAATILGYRCWWWRVLSLLMMLCHVDFSLGWSTWRYGDTTVAGVHTCRAVLLWHLNTGLSQALSPKGNPQISHWVYPAAMGGWCFWQSCHPKHFHRVCDQEDCLQPAQRTEISGCWYITEQTGIVCIRFS